MITCQKCRALLEPGTKVCPYCRTDQRHHLAPSETQDAERTTRFGLWILGLIVGIYALMLILDPARSDLEGKGFQPSSDALAMFGATEQELVRGCGQYWRLLASMFLHVDLLHLTFNSVALLILIPIAAGAFGVHRTVCLYFATGLSGAWLSLMQGSNGVGASGALCGLIGACAVYGYRRGGMFGHALMRRMIGWAVFIAIFGIAWNGTGGATRVDSAAHLGGFAGGLALGWLAAGVRARGGRGDRAWMFLARATVVVTILVAAVFWAPFVLRISDRREIELYWREADRTLRAIEASLREGNAEGLPPSFPEGPSGTDGVRDAVREALAMARQRDPGAGAALERATDTLFAWSSSLYCTHCIVPSE